MPGLVSQHLHLHISFVNEHSTRAYTIETWYRCLSFDNGLAGALHVAVPPPETRFPLPTPTPTASPPPQGGGQEGTGGEEGGFSSQNLVLALVASLLAQPSEAESSASNAISKDDDDDDSAADAGMAEYQPGHIGSSAPRRGLLGVWMECTLWEQQQHV